jgi:DNA helicase-2/ATP-dependent DNA helicase PcrA
VSVEQHPAYAEESQHLAETKAEITAQIAALQEIVPPQKDEDELREDPMDAVEVAERSLMHMRGESIRRLKVALREPYFGRIDFQEHGSAEVQALYIGKVGLERGEAHEPVVIDWRAPVASLFYNTALSGTEEASYWAPDGEHTGSIWLKRNFGIEQGILQRIVDSRVKGAPDEGEEILDEFLQYRLEESRDSRLRDIVSTIQAEQNAIIRAPMVRPLIIQGVAGSGKTTVALHRLAYLLYTFRGKVEASRVVIFAPNRMFLTYISDVLPELGVGGVLQTTFADWALEELDEKVRLTDPADRMELLFAPGSDPGEGFDAPGRFKGSLYFKEVLDRAVAEYEANFVPDVDFVLWPGATIKAETIRAWFHEQYRLWPLMTRKERIFARIKKFAEDRFLPYVGSMQEQERRKAVRSAITKYRSLWPSHTALQLYQEILGAPAGRGKVPAQVGYPDIPERVRRESLQLFKKKEIAPEDLAPLVYLKGKLRGYKEDRQLDHVVIDEAQDFSPFQLDLLKSLTRENSFTILGDLSQGIHAYAGIHAWEEFMDVFEPQLVSYHTLETSYRSTQEIITFANEVITKVGTPAALARPVFRSGAPVQVEEVAPSARAARIKAEVERLREQKLASIAVLARTEEEAKALHKELTELGLEPELILPHQTEYRGGLSVVPVYLVKGLEFDAVIVANASAEAYQFSPRDAKLLYVACTRALHALLLLWSGAPSPLLPGS